MTVGAQLKIALAAATLASLAACGGKSEAEAVDSAKALLAKREYGPAMIELKSALQRSPNSSQVRFLMGEALLAQGDTAAAEVELHKALDLGFDENKVVPLLARAWLIGGKNKELVQTHAHTALRDANAQSQLSAALALAYSQLRMTKEADASIAAALDAAKDNPFTLLAKARILAGGGKSDEALATADKVVAADSTNGEAQMFRGLLLYYAKQDPAGAIQALEIAAKNPQEVLRARPMLISIYIRQKKLDKAKAELDALKAAYPGKGQTLYMEAVVAFVTEDYKRCNVLAEQLLRAAPSNTLFLILGGASDLHLGKFIAAESKLGKVVQTVQGAKEARKLLAETYSRMGQPEKALSVLRPMLEEGKPDAEVLALAGQAYLYLADAKQAQAMLTAASTLKPEDLKLRTSLALLELARGSAAHAFESLRTIAETDTGTTANLAIISSHLRRREFDAALAAVADLEKKPAGKKAAPYLRGVALRGKGDKVAARSAFEAAAKLEPGNMSVVLAVASLDEEEGHADVARKRLETALAEQPQNTAVHMALLELMRRQRVPSAELQAQIDKAIQAAPSEPSPRLAKLVQLSRDNDVKGAALAAQQAIAAQPNEPDVLDAAGRALAASGDYQQAISAFNKQVSATPRSARPHLRLAEVHATQGNRSAVAASLGRAFELEPLSTDVLGTMLIHAVRSKDFKQVTAAAKDLQKRFGKSSIGFELEGDIYLAQGRHDQAAAAYRAGLKQSQTTGVAIKLHRVLDQGGSTSSDAFAKEWLGQHPTDAAFQAFLGDRARKQKDYAAAERYYKGALAHEPEHAGVMNNLAWTLGQARKPGAIEFAEKAVKLAPQQANFMDTLAELHSAAGQHAQAVEWERKALMLRPQDTALKLSLAKYLLASGDKQESKKLLSELAKLGSGYPGHAEVQGLLGRL